MWNEPAMADWLTKYGYTHVHVPIYMYNVYVFTVYVYYAHTFMESFG